MLKLIGGIVLAVVGCNPPQEPGSVLIQKMADLNPVASPGQRAVLITGPVRNPVEIKMEREGDRFRLDLVAHGEVFESEVYKVDDKSFSLIEAAADQFDPPIPLLTFPLTSSPRQYSGKLTAGVERNVKAKITASMENVFAPNSAEAVKIVVELSMDSGSPTPASRNLTFWFVKDRGIVKREFGNGLTREPVSAEE